ncbi:MAG: B12-binding domain-containing radical SAM protein [Elusimicrobia bacterium CG_4_10_14_0_2_um_filter_56_8]|nr:MAG: B12-binding domain-containing radical SAM protein [Elusimicrobia bacterium CG1_02_56_21]PJA12066.1 MAG: B12-binding domain-containing radical SAM protein [Elusimicrobia bacterium CG_4_10_14_0_2_um_filter_56_8]
MPDIVLATFNARYEHSSFGLRCLMANLGGLARRAAMLELNSGLRTAEAAEAILALKPRILGLGVYVWNAAESALLVSELKRLRPELVIVLGGPEVSYETLQQQICRDADYVIKGEGEAAFAALCLKVLSGTVPDLKIIEARVPVLSSLALPYGLYNEDDIANRVIYAETSRGCPFGCEFCLSSLDKGVRDFPLEPLLSAWEELLSRGALRFKFVDRTFNLDTARAAAILEFFLGRYKPGLFLHFEMVPDRFPEELYCLVKKFPEGSLQLEVGVQTFNEAVAYRIGRRQDNSAVERNIRRLRKETSAHLHADLIAGLPGEDLASFAAGFDRLAALGPQEIQVGILKRLRGAPISRHDTDRAMVYSPYPPYELRQNSLLDFFAVQRLRRFARYWELISNSGVFAETVALICGEVSQFGNFLALSDWLYSRTGQTHSISRSRLRDLISLYLTGELKQPAGKVAEMSERDAIKARRGSRSGAARQARRRE